MRTPANKQLAEIVELVDKIDLALTRVESRAFALSSRIILRVVKNKLTNLLGELERQIEYEDN